MPILNYTTSIATDKTVGEIQKTLVQTGAKQMLSEYGNDDVITALSFRIPHNDGMLTFRLPARIDSIYVILQNDNRVTSRKHRTREHAARVAWRIIKDWVEAQVALIEAQQVELPEVFLPYLQDEVTGATLYERLSESGFKQLPAPDQQA